MAEKISKISYRIDSEKGKTFWARTLEEAKEKERSMPDSWGKTTIKKVTLAQLLNHTPGTKIK